MTYRTIPRYPEPEVKRLQGWLRMIVIGVSAGLSWFVIAFTACLIGRMAGLW
jgi:hypothetical protein